ncbi:MAG TPA: pyrroloquinoline quinone biosynthesis protein PqqE [Rhizomicrobium sp.]|nr:pyrroloquinoline quinone biosynthesis protein PqqE [Rhizomicrobium sp.]
MNGLAPPIALLAELTHRCPLQCPYCSNPQELDRASAELGTEEWLRVLRQAAELGCMQVHFSGGEPTARRDLERLVEGAAAAGLYTNLITSGVLLDAARVARLAAAGLEHVQVSFQDCDAEGANRIAGFAGHAKKLEVAAQIRAAGLPLTLNFVVHRQNLDRLDGMIELAVALGAQRAEIAHVQYYGWALRNRAALIPTREQLGRATETVEAACARLQGVLTIDYVVPDYYARRPKACMGGWGRRFLNVTPSGKVLPCHAAESIEGMVFENVRDRALSEIWRSSDAFNRFRGTHWMPEPCRSCDRAEIDWGGCRCQAFALTADAARTDPACALSPDHAAVTALATEESAASSTSYIYRNFSAPPAAG